MGEKPFGVSWCPLWRAEVWLLASLNVSLENFPKHIHILDRFNDSQQRGVRSLSIGPELLVRVSSLFCFLIRVNLL